MIGIGLEPGGPASARHVIQNSTQNFAEVSLELGGKSPFIVFPDADIDSAVDAALRLAQARSAPEVFIAGGASVYAQALPRVSRVYRTVLHERLDNQPALDEGALAGWREVHSERRMSGSGGFPDQTYSVIERPA